MQRPGAEGSAGEGGGEHRVAPRRVGRPRLNPQLAGALQPREEILQVAAGLFAARGYAATSTRLIAERVGVRQASLFHHFAHKEDILAELLDRTVRPALAFSEWLDEQRPSLQGSLFALASWDAHNLCSRPDNLSAVQLIHEARDERFGSFWTKREQLRSAYRRPIAELVPEGEAALATDLVFGLVESVLTWYQHGGGLSAEAVASAIARGALGIAGIPRRGIGRAEHEAVVLGERYRVSDL